MNLIQEIFDATICEKSCRPRDYSPTQENFYSWYEMQETRRLKCGIWKIKDLAVSSTMAAQQSGSTDSFSQARGTWTLEDLQRVQQAMVLLRQMQDDGRAGNVIINVAPNEGNQAKLMAWRPMKR